ASTSPRRRQLMRHLGLPFAAVASNYREVHHKHLSPAELVRFLAEGKARAAAGRYRDAIIIGADTVIVHGGKIYGKPKNRLDAKRMLKSLSGKTHRVVTGVVLIDTKSNKILKSVVITKVTLFELNSRGVKNYLDDAHYLDKAAAYAAQEQGAGLIKKIQGDFTNVVGLPLERLKIMLKKFKVRI
ncbi:MAG: septum formation protein Maf, partial [Patescibacteria group bacterium]|nr:septum formation protein Maf [Patescibacteria group bacterium]